MPFHKSRKSKRERRSRRNKHKKTRRMYHGGQALMTSIAPVGISPYNNLF